MVRTEIYRFCYVFRVRSIDLAKEEPHEEGTCIVKIRPPQLEAQCFIRPHGKNSTAS